VGGGQLRPVTPRLPKAVFWPLSRGILLCGGLTGTAESARATFSARLVSRVLPSQHPPGWVLRASPRKEAGPARLRASGGWALAFGALGRCCREAWRGLIPCPVAAVSAPGRAPLPGDPDPRAGLLAQALTCFAAVGLLGGHWAVSDPSYHCHT